MADANIDRFNDFVADIFARLYTSFPIPADLKYADLTGEEEVRREALTAESEFAKATIEWLERSGYIHVAGYVDPFFAYGAVLSHKGLEVLKAMPASLAAQKTIGETLRQTMKDTGKEVRRKTVDVALAEGVKLLFS